RHRSNIHRGLRNHHMPVQRHHRVQHLHDRVRGIRPQRQIPLTSALMTRRNTHRATTCCTSEPAQKYSFTEANTVSDPDGVVATTANGHISRKASDDAIRITKPPDNQPVTPGAARTPVPDPVTARYMYPVVSVGAVLTLAITTPN